MTERLLRGGCLMIVVALIAGSARAHPAAQGRIDFDVQAGRITATVTVSAEEVFVGTTLGKLPEEPKTLAETWRAYGGYLLRHVAVQADGRALTGELKRVVAPENSPPAPVAMAVERAVYVLEFPLGAGAARPGKIQVTQDCLAEISYAPGNPWTASYVAKVAREGRTVREGLLLESQRPLVIELPAGGETGPALSQASIWAEYFRHGVWHILTGYDHLLFVTALALATVTLWDLVKFVIAFTLAHTLTLVLSVLNIVRLPSTVVEPMIAASIVFVALQNTLFPRTSRGWTRLAAAFGFGLFHGLGFAGGLLDAMAELPATAMMSALSAFSLGVEVGHQCVVLPVFFAVAWCVRKSGGSWRLPVLRSGSAVIAGAGIFYLVAALRG
jgi:hydrogenase/urease accessory protein HupE